MSMNMGLCVLTYMSAGVLRDQRPLVCRAGALGGYELKPAWVLGSELGSSARAVKETPAEWGLSPKPRLGRKHTQAPAFTERSSIYWGRGVKVAA